MSSGSWRKWLARLRGVPYVDPAAFGALGAGCVVKGSSVFEHPERITFGDYCYVGPWAFWSALAEIRIGNNVIFGPRTVLYTQNHNYRSEQCLPFGPSDEDINKPIVVGDNVWVGLGVHVLPGVTIGEGAVVGMASVVTKDVPPLSLAVGCPAKVIGQRDREVYERLKAEKKFVLKVKGARP